jgi:exosortase
LASRTPTALWPFLGKPVLEHLLEWLADQGIRQVTLCYEEDIADALKAIRMDKRLELEFLAQPLPSGTAGSLRDAIRGRTVGTVLVLSSSIISPPEIDTLLAAHRSGKADLTIAFNPTTGNCKSLGEPADIYMCETAVLRHIPEKGFFDIKEGLVREMVFAGRSVHSVLLRRHAGNFRDRRGYLYAVNGCLDEAAQRDPGLRLLMHNESQHVRAGKDVTIDPDARFLGPVVIMDDAHIDTGAVIAGPSVIGRNVVVGKNSVVVNSVLWENAKVGADCTISRCVVDNSAVICSHTSIENESIVSKSGTTAMRLVNRAKKLQQSSSKIEKTLQPYLKKFADKLPAAVKIPKVQYYFLAAVVVVAFLWSYWSGLVELWGIWQRSDEYSAGLLVPFLAAYVIWSRRHNLVRYPIKPSLWGLIAFIFAQAFRLFGLFFMYGSAERLSIVFSVAALVLFLFGWRMFWKLSTVLLFLCLMLPWPNRVQTAISLPLQSWSTSSAVFCLELAGYTVVREGNVIHIGGATVAVAEACNGLRMITAFFVISGLVVLLARCSWWEKLIVLVSSLPVALLCNTLRLAITSIFFTVLKGEYWEKVFHDFGGYAMMPLALAILVAELWLLEKLTTDPVAHEPVVIISRKNKA